MKIRKLNKFINEADNQSGMKKYIGLTLEQAIKLAKAENRKIKYHEETDDEYEWLELSTADGNGVSLSIEDGVVTEFTYLDWI